MSTTARLIEFPARLRRHIELRSETGKALRSAAKWLRVAALALKHDDQPHEAREVELLAEDVDAHALSCEQIAREARALVRS